MTFTSNLFLIGIIPWYIMIAYLLRKIRYSKTILIFLGNCVFYIWGGVGAFFYICAFAVVLWGFTRIISVTKNKYIFAFLIVLTSIPLILVKYTVFFISNLNAICHFTIQVPKIVVPIGISFFTFEAISLLTDTYRNEILYSNSVLDTLLYITFFPTVTSGPILRYNSFKEGLISPISPDNYNDSILRIARGLCKKILIADKIAILADYYFDGVSRGNTYSVVGLWMGSIAYTLQLYFDFSGYSDMAIGIGGLLGFQIPENFKLPYQARSISDFWKRWHISLSQWFRDYIYIPLGGNRCSVNRHIFNMLVVWLLTGIWHGADWSFVVWGIGYFFLLILEKYVPGMKRITESRFGHIYTLFFVNLLWIPFRSKNLFTAKQYIFGLAGIRSRGTIESIALEYIPYVIVAILLCCPIDRGFTPLKNRKGYKVLKGIAVLIAVFWAMCAVLNTTYTPYIYGNF